MLLSAGASACNAITGARERTLDPDLGTDPDRDTGPIDDEDTGANDVLDGGKPDQTSVPDAKIDGAPTEIVVNVKGNWFSPNGAAHAIVANGVKIGSMDASAANNHPVIFPSPQPNIPSENYTIRATVLAPPAGGFTPEFGILTRVQPNGSSIVLANVYGASPPAFLGHVPSSGGSPWNPSNDAKGPNYTYVASARYKFVLKVIGAEVRGKFWISTDQEPATDQMVIPSAPYATGRGVGFYTYFTHDAVLEDMVITVP